MEKIKNNVINVCIRTSEKKMTGQNRKVNKKRQIQKVNKM